MNLSFRPMRSLLAATAIFSTISPLRGAMDYQIEWIRQFAEQDARSVMVNGAGEILVGTAASLRKYDAQGGLLSIVPIRVPSRSVALDDESNIYVCGTSRDAWVRPSAGQGDVVFSKLDPAGNLLWMRQWGDQYQDSCTQVVVHPSGYIYTSNYGFLGVVSVRRFDTEGNELWVRQPPTAREGDGLAVDAAGNVYVAGYGTNGGDETAYVAELSPTGQQVLTVNLNSSGQDYAHSVLVDHAGNIFLTGSTNGRLGESYGGGDDIFLAKFDPQGNRIWVSQLGAGFARYEYGRDLAVNSKGEIFVVGSRTTATERENGILSKFSADGHLQWTTSFASPQQDYLWSIAVDNSDNVYIAGDTFGAIGGPNEGLWDGYLVKLAPATVPEPCGGMLALSGAIVASLAAARRKKRKA